MQNCKWTTLTKSIPPQMKILLEWANILHDDITGIV